MIEVARGVQVEGEPWVSDDRGMGCRRQMAVEACGTMRKGEVGAGADDEICATVIRRGDDIGRGCKYAPEIDRGDNRQVGMDDRPAHTVLCGRLRRTSSSFVEAGPTVIEDRKAQLFGPGLHLRISGDGDGIGAGLCRGAQGPDGERFPETGPGAGVEHGRKPLLGYPKALYWNTGENHQRGNLPLKVPVCDRER